MTPQPHSHPSAGGLILRGSLGLAGHLTYFLGFPGAVQGGQPPALRSGQGLLDSGGVVQVPDSRGHLVTHLAPSSARPVLPTGEVLPPRWRPPPALGCIAPGESSAPLSRSPRVDSPWGQGSWVPCAERIMMAEQRPELPWALLWTRAQSASHHSSRSLSGLRGQRVIVTPDLWVRCTSRVSERDGGRRGSGAGGGWAGQLWCPRRPSLLQTWESALSWIAAQLPCGWGFLGCKENGEHVSITLVLGWGPRAPGGAGEGA